MVKSQIKPGTLEKLRVEFKIPQEYVIRMPGKEVKPRCRKREMAISVTQMALGLRFPPSNFLVDFLSIYGISPTQLTPDSLALLSAYSWCCEAGSDDFPTVLGVKRLFIIEGGVKKGGDGLGDYRLQCRSDHEFLDSSVIDWIPSGWRSLWFYIRIPDHDAIPLGRNSVDTHVMNELTSEDREVVDIGCETIKWAIKKRLTVAVVLNEAFEARIPPLRRRDDLGFNSSGKPFDKDADVITIPEVQWWIKRMKTFAEKSGNLKLSALRASGEIGFRPITITKKALVTRAERNTIQADTSSSSHGSDLEKDATAVSSPLPTDPPIPPVSTTATHSSNVPLSRALSTLKNTLGKRQKSSDIPPTYPQKKQRSEEIQSHTVSTTQGLTSVSQLVSWPGDGSGKTEVRGLNFDKRIQSEAKYGDLPSDRRSALKIFQSMVPQRAMEECASMTPRDARGVVAMHNIQSYAAVYAMYLNNMRDQEQLEELKKENQELSEKNKALQRLESAEDKLREMDSQLTQQRRDSQAEKEDHLRKIHIERRRTSRLQEKVERIEAELKNNKEKSTAEKKVLDEQIHSLEKECNEKTSLYSATEESFVNTMKELTATEEKLSEVVIEKSRFSKLVDDLVDTLSDLVNRVSDEGTSEKGIEPFLDDIADDRVVLVIKKVWGVLKSQRRMILQKTDKISDHERQIEEIKEISAEEYGNGIISVLPKIWLYFEQLQEKHGIDEADLPSFEWFLDIQPADLLMPADLKRDLERKVREICKKSLDISESDSDTAGKQQIDDPASDNDEKSDNPDSDNGRIIASVLQDIQMQYPSGDRIRSPSPAAQTSCLIDAPIDTRYYSSFIPDLVSILDMTCD